MGGYFHIHLPRKKQQHHHHNHGGSSSSKGGATVPKGCVAIKVGLTIEEQQRFVVPVLYFNHPLFMKLVKKAEDEYGFNHKGAITIPSHVEEFRYVQGLIDHHITIIKAVSIALLLGVLGHDIVI